MAAWEIYITDWTGKQRRKSTADFPALIEFLTHRTKGRAYATVLRPSVVCHRLYTERIVAKRCVLVLEQKLLLIIYMKSHMRNRLVSK